MQLLSVYGDLTDEHAVTKFFANVVSPSSQHRYKPKTPVALSAVGPCEHFVCVCVCVVA